MSKQFVTKSGIGSTSTSEMYKCGGDNAVVFGLSLANNQSSQISISVTLFSDSNGTTIDVIAPNTLLDAKETLVPIGGIQKFVMNENDKLQVSCSTSNGVDFIVSAMEFTDYIW